MKKCCIYLDALEEISREDSAAWQDVRMHAGRCPDCATDMRLRGDLLEFMAEIPEPDYPAALHSTIMGNLEDARKNGDTDDTPSWLSRFFERMLQPLELVVSVGCLVMFMFLMQIDHSSQFNLKPVRPALLAGKSIPGRTGNRQPPETQALETVSAAEVDQFMRQLQEFNRTHPAQRRPQIDYTPELRLVNDLSNRRQP
ncbi:MAG: hypothetical protein KKB51_14570 [Candidatus Riflebacteria bacterium]|nr:hypothetical protein [Candidatus Riflebacteria bacterium]